MAKKKVSFVEFFLLWAKLQRWEVPDIHIIACHWLEHRGKLAVLRCFRGFGKSTILAVYNAWRFYKDPTYRILHQSETDGTALKTSRDTQNVLRKHPLTKDLLADGTVIQWWVNGSTDSRNASMYSKGILVKYWLEDDEVSHAGISFAPADRVGEVGDIWDREPNKILEDLNPVFVVKASNVESLIVVRDAIDRAIKWFNEQSQTNQS